MITMVEKDRDGSKYWSATGKGPLRVIAAEGRTRVEARTAWHTAACMQRDEKQLSDEDNNHEPF